MDKETLLKLIDDLTFERTDYIRVLVEADLTGDATMHQAQTFRLVNADILKGFIEADVSDDAFKQAEAEIVRLRRELRELRYKEFGEDFHDTLLN